MRSDQLDANLPDLPSLTLLYDHRVTFRDAVSFPGAASYGYSWRVSDVRYGQITKIDRDGTCGSSVQTKPSRSTDNYLQYVEF